MPGQRSLTPDETAMVQACLAELVEREGSQIQAAKAIGVTQQAVSKALTGKIGYALARSVAGAFGTSFEEMVGHAKHGDRPGPGKLTAPRRDFLQIATSELVELVSNLAVRQLRDTIDRSRDLSAHGVELADAALELVSRVRPLVRGSV